MKGRLSARARRDLQDLVRHISRDSPRAGRLVRDRIKDAVQRLSLTPESERLRRVDGTRELVIPHTAHSAVYRMANGTLEVIAFLHEARQWPDDL